MTDALSIARIYGIHKFVPIPEAEDHLRLGWMALLGEHHPVMADYRVHMTWCCRCKMVIPAGERDENVS
jgi:hypothetical protein